MKLTLVVVVLACGAFGWLVGAMTPGPLTLAGWTVLVVGSFCIGYTLTGLRHGGRR